MSSGLKQAKISSELARTPAVTSSFSNEKLQPRTGLSQNSCRTRNLPEKGVPQALRISRHALLPAAKAGAEVGGGASFEFESVLDESAGRASGALEGGDAEAAT